MADISKIVTPSGNEYNLKDASAREDLSAKADKTDTVLLTTLSRGRKANTIVGLGSFAFGNDVGAAGSYAHAEGAGTAAGGAYSHAEGLNTGVSGMGAHAEGYGSQASGNYAHAEGYNSIASGYYAHAEGSGGSMASGNSAHAEGYYTEATKAYSHAEGNNTHATGDTSHAEGYRTTASGPYSHAEGNQTTASGNTSHAEGANTIASNAYAHAEGNYTEATGVYSHAEGSYARANGSYSHAEGYLTTAVAEYSHAEGYLTKANGGYSHVQGYHNFEEDERTAQTVPDISLVASYDPGHGFYTCGSMVKYNDQIWIAHTSAPTVRSKPKYANYIWARVQTPTEEQIQSATEWSATGLYVLNDVVVSDGLYYKKISADITLPYMYPGVAPEGTIFWHTQPAGSTTSSGFGKYADVVGNGTQYTAGRNISSLDWDGNLRLAGNVYIKADDSGENGTKVLSDVQLNGTSVANDGIAYIPIAGDSLGVVKIDSSYGIGKSGSGRIYIIIASDAQIKAGTHQYNPIVPSTQYKSVFYGLARAAGDFTQASSNNNIGVYTSEAQTAIQSMLGLNIATTTETQAIITEYGVSA